MLDVCCPGSGSIFMWVLLSKILGGALAVVVFTTR